MSLLRIVPYTYVPTKKRSKQNLHHEKSVNPDTRVHGPVNQNDLRIGTEAHDQEGIDICTSINVMVLAKKKTENSSLGICISELRDRNASQRKTISMQPEEKGTLKLRN